MWHKKKFITIFLIFLVFTFLFSSALGFIFGQEHFGIYQWAIFLLGISFSALVIFFRQLFLSSNRKSDEIAWLAKDEIQKGLSLEDILKNEKRFRELANLFPEMLCETDISGKIVYANEAAYHKFGYNKTDVASGLYMFSLIAPADVQRAKENLQRRKNDPTFPKQEYLALKKNGKTFPVLVQTDPVYEKGMHTGYRGVMIDIAIQKEKEKQLQLSHSFNKKIIENSPVGIVVFDQNHQLVLSNSMMDEIFELDFKKFNEKDPDYEMLWVNSGIRKIIDDVTGFNNTAIHNVKITNTYDESKWLSVTALPYELDSQIHVLLLMSDISHQVQYENELKELNMQMSSQNMIFIAQNEEIKRINKLLKEKEARIRKKSAELDVLTNNIDVQVWYLQEPNLYGAVNQAHATFLGKPIESLMHKNINEVLPVFLAGKFQKLYTSVFNQKKEFQTEQWLKNGKGEERLIQIKLVPEIHKKSGVIEFVVCSGIDITEQRKAEEKLTYNLRQQRHLSSISYAFNSLEDFDLIITRAFEEIGLHAGLCRISLFEKEEGSNHFTCAYEWCQANVQSRKVMDSGLYVSDLSAFYAFLAKGEVFTPGGDKPVPGSIRSFTLQGKAKSFLLLPVRTQGHYTAFVCFENDRKSISWESSELELLQIVVNLISNKFSKKKILDRLSSSEKKFRSLYEHMDEAFMIISDRLIVDCNQATLSLLGFEQKQELLDHDVLFISPDYQKENLPSSELTSHFYDLADQQGSCRFEWLFEKKDGTVFHAEVTLTCQKLENRKVYFGICHDIEKLKRYQYELQKAKDAAEKANNLKSLFLANVSHEIRTPMNAILGYARILAKRGLPNPMDNYVNIIHHSGKNLLALLNDILDLSKIEAGKLHIELKPLLLPSLFDEMKNIFSLKCQEQSIRFALDIDPNLPEKLILDQARLRQVLFNLVGNAVKFTDSGDVRLSVKLQNQYAGEVDFSIVVEDTGIGIAEDQLGEIFNTFQQQAGQNSKYGGTGLGLAITKKLVEMMGGEISVSSKIGAGSKFTVTFFRIAAYESQLHDEKPALSSCNYIFKGEKVLIVEDNPVNLELINTMLKDHQLQTLLAANGQIALELIRAEKPDIVLLDMKMPVMDGFETITHLRADQNIRNLPVVAMSAQAMKEDEKRMLDSGCDAFVPKPIDEDLLLNTIGALLYAENEIKEDAETGKTNHLHELVEGIDRAVVNQQIISSLYLQYETNSKSMQLDDWKAFGEQLKNLGEEYNILSFVHLGDEFIKSINDYDIKKLKATIHKYRNVPGIQP